MMSYVIQTGKDDLLVIDGGTEDDADYLRDFLLQRGGKVEAWILTHPHIDHGGALSVILGEPEAIRINRIYASMPEEEWVKKHEAYRMEDFKKIRSALDATQVEIMEPEPGQRVNIGGLVFDFLGVKNPEITGNAINNSSMVFRVRGAGESVLFLGDIGVQAGKKILSGPYAEWVKADWVQMSHHGQNGADRAFYEAVDAEGCFWPTPGWLWDNDNGGGKGSGPWKTLEVRQWMEDLGVQQHLVAKDGLAKVDFGACVKAE
jgi:beta-lactamase superfamily II metal-dependent hydrolase